MTEDSPYGTMPAVYKKDKATIILLIDGIIDFTIGFLYVFILRNLLIRLTGPIQEAGYVDFNIILLFDIVILLEFLIAIFELIAVYYIKFTDNTQIPNYIKKIFIVSHIILIPLGGLINYIIDLILM